jgi:hypothetical protein
VFSLVDMQGCVLASAAGAFRQPLHSFKTMFPSISASNDRLYYLDGDHDLRFLAPDGTSGHISDLPVNAQQMGVFAVSPDNHRIAVSIFDYSQSPTTVRLYVEDLAAGSHHTEIYKSSDAFVWPVGWHGDQLVVRQGIDQPFVAGGSTSTYGQPPEIFRLMNASTGAMTATLGSPTCPIQIAGFFGTLLSPMGATCLTDPPPAGCPNRCLQALYWDGRSVEFSHRANLITGAALSPDGQRIAACCIDGRVAIFGSPASGGKETVTSFDGYIGNGGWLDDTHFVIHQAGGYGLPPTSFYDSVRGTLTPSMAIGELFARLPGGL